MPTKKSHKEDSLAQKLIDAQVAFYMKDLSAKNFKPILKREVETVYDLLGELKLKDAVSIKKVKDTAKRYAVEMEIGGGIPELFGEIAQIIYTYPENEETKVGDIVSDEIAEEFLRKIFEHESVLDHTVRNVRNSKAFRNFVSDLVVTVVKGYLLEQNRWAKSGVVGTGTKALRNWMSNLAPDLADTIEEQIHKLTASAVENSLEMFDEVLDSQQYRDTAQNSTLALWDEVKTWPIARFQTYVSEEDLQDFMVLGYEFWHQFRHTEYLQACIETGVEFFFHKYGRMTLQELLAELGVTREMVIGEIMNYGPDLAKLAIKTGWAEQFFREHVTRFYDSEEARALLA